jgi:3-keto-5-aminohexanoate cleavage enzyme
MKMGFPLEFPDMVLDCPTHYGTTVEDALKWAKEGLIDISPVRPSPSYTAEELITTSPQATVAMTKFLQEHGIKPQIAVFYPGMIDNTHRYLIKTRILKKPYYWIIMPGLPGGDMPNPMAMFESLLIYVRRIKEIDPDSVWIVGATGRASCYVTTAAMLLGGHIRVGMEDVLYRYPHKDVMLTNNVEEVKLAIQLSQLLGREVATPNEYREIIGLPTRS